jgi:leucyl aminopeptidase
LRAVTLAPATLAPASGAVLTRTRTIAEAVYFARDLTNTPSDRKTPAWLAAQIAEAGSAIPNLSAAVNGPDWLAERGFGGILAVARGSAHEPRLVTLRWEPAGASRHIVLIGKGVTFDTGGIVIKPRDSMKLMRKDMGAAAAVVAATIGAAALRLPVRVTTLAPLAENAIGADAFRPGDVIRHFGGVTSEILNTDAEGRLLLGDALAYAAADLDPDVIVDLGTLTGAQSVALGKRTAALFSHDDALAAGLTEAAVRAGESVWRMPLADEYTERMDSDIADLTNSVESGGGGCITAALYLRELVGEARDRWAHLDMSAPAWSDSASGELAKGATGWGVRTLISWLSALGE